MWREWVLATLILFCIRCGPRARVEGEVKEYFGGPLEGVTVGISGTQFSTTTEKNGKYSLEYIPGRFQLEFSKEGYREKQLDFEISAETRVPVEQISLLKLPPGTGVYFVGESGYELLPLGRLIYNTGEYDSWNHSRTSTYEVAGDFAKLKPNSPLVFLDNSRKNIALFAVDANSVVLTSLYNSGTTRDDGDRRRDSVEEIVPGYLRREIQLQPGRYAFVAVRWDEISLNRTTQRIGARLNPVTDPIYMFEVVGPES